MPAPEFYSRGAAAFGSLKVTNAADLNGGANVTGTLAAAAVTATSVAVSGAAALNGGATIAGNVAISGGTLTAKLPAAPVTASTTQTLNGATQLGVGISKITCANASDAVKLPIATGGEVCVVITVGAAATPQIFPGQSGDQIDAVTAGASTTLTAAHRGAVFYADAAGHWTSTLFGAVAT